MKITLWDSIKDVDDVPVLAANWAELFRSMQHERARFTTFGVEMMTALEAHCDAMNALNGGAVSDYMRVVEDQIGVVNKQLAHARCLLEASAGLNVANTAPAVIAATNLWNPVGWFAGAVSVSAAGASIGCKVGGESALKEVESMICDCPRVIEERTCGNAITRTSSTMLPIANLLKGKFGEEKANAAYFVLLGALMAHSKRKLFDLEAIPDVVTELINVATSSEFPTLLRYVRDASLSPLTPSDAAEKFGASMLDSMSRLKVAVTDSSISSLTIIAGCVLKPICKKVDKGLEVLIMAMARGSLQWDAAQIAAKESQVAMVFQLTGKLSIAFAALAIIGALVSAGFGIAELVEMDKRLKPYKDAIDEVRTNHRVFAEAIEEVPRLLRRYNVATFAGKRSSSIAIA